MECLLNYTSVCPLDFDFNCVQVFTACQLVCGTLLNVIFVWEYEPLEHNINRPRIRSLFIS